MSVANWADSPVGVLDQEGLVVIRPGRGASVVTGDVPALLDAYRVREVIDGLAARLTTEQGAGARHVERLQVLVDAQRATLDPWDPETYQPLNVEFHGTILEASGNEYLTDHTALLQVTSNVFAPYRLLEVDRVRRAVAEHQGIVDAIRSGDGAAAERVAREHIRATIRTLSTPG